VHKNSKGVVDFLLILVALITITGIGYYAYKNRQIKFIPQQSSSESRTPSTIPSLIPPSDDLQTFELPSGDIKITNLLGKFEFVVPVTYNLAGNAKNLSVNFKGADGGYPGPRDFAEVQFRILELEKPTLQDQVRDTYTTDKKGAGETPNYDDIKKITLGKANGYSYSCFFLVEQNCIYLPMDNQKYLFILTRYEDRNNRGYQNEIDQILSTFKFMD